MYNEFAEAVTSVSEVTPPTQIPGDTFEPANPQGESDLNLHLLDMDAEPDVSQDPYARSTS